MVPFAEWLGPSVPLDVRAQFQQLFLANKLYRQHDIVVYRQLYKLNKNKKKQKKKLNNQIKRDVKKC